MTTVTIGQNTADTYSGTEDTYISLASPTTNFGTNNSLGVAPNDRTLIRFTGLTNIPSNAIVSAVTLFIDRSAGSGVGTYSLYKCLRPWVEAQATHNIYSTGNAWTTAGAQDTTNDHDPTVLASLVDPVGDWTFASGAGLVALVQGWIDGSITNNGFLIQEPSGATFRTMKSSAVGILDGERPKLTVTYTIPSTGGPTGFKKWLLAAGFFAATATAVFTADIGGWKTYTPVTSSTFTVGDGLSTTAGIIFSYSGNTGTRLHYVDPSQTVATTMLALDLAATYVQATNPHGGPYFWNGTNIIDASNNTAPLSGPYAGVPYGTDPFEPSAAVQAFKRVSYCLLNVQGNNRVRGTTSNGASGSAGSAAYNGTGTGRIGKPDWILIKRGTTLNLQEDIYDLCVTSNGALVTANMSGSLTMPGGTSLSAMNVVGAYGPPTDDRPVITHAPKEGFTTRGGNGSQTKKIEYLAFVSLYFDGHDRTHYPVDEDVPGFTMLYNAGTAGNHDVWWEDCTFTGTGGFNIQTGATCYDFWRCQLYDTFGDHVSGLFTHNTGLSEVNHHACIFGRNGFTVDPTVTPNVGYSDRDRNFYMAGEASKDQIIEDSLVLPGGSGDQFRCGMRAERNYFLPDVGFSAQNGAAYGTAQTDTGGVLDNVFERFYYGPFGGGGFGIYYGAHDVDASYNVVTDAGMASADRAAAQAEAVALSRAAGGLSFGGQPEGWYHPQLAPTTGNRTHHNVVINRNGTTSLSASEGVSAVAYLGATATNYVATDGAATWNDLTIRNTKTLTGAVSGGVGVIPVSSISHYTGGGNWGVGTNVGVVLANASIHWTTIASVASLNVTLAAVLPSNANSGATVYMSQPANYDYPATLDNLYDFNTLIGQSNTDPDAGIYYLYDGTPLAPGDSRADSTTRENNVHLTTAAASGLGYDIDRCLYTACIANGFTPSDTAQEVIVNELVDLLKSTMRKGQYDPKWLGPNLVNHVRAGVGLTAI